MNKKIKSLLVAGLLVVGMGFTSVDSYAAEMTNSITEFNFVNIDGGPVASVHTFEDGNITITIRDVSGYSGNPDGTHEISANWNTSMIDMKSIDVVTMYNAIEASKETTKLELQDGQAFLRIKVDIEQAIDEINLEYELAGSGEEEQDPAVSFNDAEQKVINKYRESMAAVGVLNNGERQIDTSFMIEKQAWLDFIEEVKKVDINKQSRKAIECCLNQLFNDRPFWVNQTLINNLDHDPHALISQRYCNNMFIYDWLQQNNLHPNFLYLDKDCDKSEIMSMCGADVLIDDMIKHVKKCIQNGIPAILIRHYSNQHINFEFIINTLKKDQINAFYKKYFWPKQHRVYKY